MIAQVDKPFLAGQLLALVAIAAMCVALPGAPVVSTTLAMAFIWGVAALAYRRTEARNKGGWWALLVAATLMGVAVVANVYMVTTFKGHGLAEPIFDNTDMQMFYNEALAWQAGDTETVRWYMERFGYGLLISLLWHVTGVSVVPPLLLNMLAVLLSMVVTGVVTRRLLEGVTPRGSAWLQTAGMIATGGVVYFLMEGTLLMREALTGLGIAVMALGMQQVVTGQKGWRGPLTMLLGATMVVYLRSSWLPMPLLAMAMTFAPTRRRMALTAALLAAVVADWWLIEYFLRNLSSISYYNADNLYVPVQSSFLYDVPSRRVFNALFGQMYFAQPWYVRMLLLPVVACTQYLTPLPWGFAFDWYTAPGLAAVKFAYPWYALGGVLVYYYAFRFIKSPAPVRPLALTALGFWLVGAYVSGGTVSRYGVPLLPMAVPAAIYVIATCLRLKSFRIWAVVYLCLLAIALCGAYYIQHL